MFSHGTATGPSVILSDVFVLQNQLILGVMGVDIAINEIKKKTPTYRVSLLCIHYHPYICIMFKQYCDYTTVTNKTRDKNQNVFMFRGN